MNKLITDQSPRKRTWSICKDVYIIQIAQKIYNAAIKIHPKLQEYKTSLYLIKSIKSLGKCCWNKNTKTIEILLNSYILSNEECIYKTLIHEFGHAIALGENHNSVWKERTNNIAQELGYTKYSFNRTADTHDTSIFKSNILTQDKNIIYKYAVQCQKCGVIIRRKTLSKLISHPEYYKCGKCDGEFKKIKI